MQLISIIFFVMLYIHYQATRIIIIKQLFFNKFTSNTNHI